jgi:hypothetical protein
MNPARTMRGDNIAPVRARSRCDSAASMSEATSRTDVIPAASSIIPLSSDGRRRCVCMSHRPGMTVFPVASMTLAPAGTRIESAGPTAVIRSPSITMLVRGRTTPRSLSNTFPLRITIARTSGGASRRAMAPERVAR